MVQFQKLTTNFSPYTGTTYTVSKEATIQVSHALPAVHFSCLLRGQFPRWSRSRKRLSVCSVLVSRSVIAVQRTAGSASETWTVAAADGVRCARVRGEINLLLTSETATFFCVHPVLTKLTGRQNATQPLYDLSSYH